MRLLLPLALADLATLRHALLALAVAAAIGLLAFSAALNPESGAAGGEASARRLVTVNRINFTRPMPLDYARRIGQLGGVAATTHATWMGLYHPDPKNVVTAFAVDHATYFDVYSHIDSQPAQALSDFKSRRDSVLIGQDLATRIGVKPGMQLRIRSNIYGGSGDGWDFHIAGTFSIKTRDGEADYLLARYDYFDGLRHFNKGTVGRVVFSSKSVDLNDGLTRTVDDMFATSSNATVTESAASFNRSLATQTSALSNVIKLASLAALVSAGLALHAGMLFDVRHHAKELSLLKIFGFSPWTVVARSVAPAFAIAGAGALLGLAAAFAGIALLSKTGIEPYGSLQLSDIALLAPCAAALALAVAGAAVPSWIAARTSVLTISQQQL